MSAAATASSTCRFSRRMVTANWCACAMSPATARSIRAPVSSLYSFGSVRIVHASSESIVAGSAQIDGAHFVCHPELGHHCAGNIRYHLQVVLSARGDFVGGDLLRRPTAEPDRDAMEKIVAAVIAPIIDRQEWVTPRERPRGVMVMRLTGSTLGSMNATRA